MRRALTVLGIAVAALVACPRDSSAGFVDFIYEMSGPQMIGTGTSCRIERVRYLKDINLPRIPELPADRIERKFRCSYFGILDGGIVVREKPPVFSWELQPAFYGSTKHNEEVTQSRRVYMVAVDPIVNLRSVRRDNGFLLEHGVGVSVQRFFVPSAPNFTRTALKLRLASVEIPLAGRWKLAISHNGRIYTDEVTGVDFRLAPKPDQRPWESALKGVLIGIYPG